VRGRVVWSPRSWREHVARQQPEYPDPEALALVLGEIAALPPLVLPDSIERLRQQLACASRGEALILQAGDCAESFEECTQGKIEGQVSLIRSMAALWSEDLSRPTVMIGRIAGQYAKPRSVATELFEGRRVPAFLGESINGLEVEERVPDPRRLLRAHFHACATLGYLRELCRDDFFTSHEGLVLALEEAHTRYDEARGAWYNHSAHMLWIGERTRELSGAHVEYFRGIANPIGVKVGPDAKACEIVEIIRRLDPARVPGKIVLITRFGRARIARLAALVAAVREAGLEVLWLADPMHGNTTILPSGYKTRDLGDITAEIEGALDAHQARGSTLHGLHLELSAEPLTECTGGLQATMPSEVPRCYRSKCDPRLSHSQALEVAAFFAQRGRARPGR
jgi:3-deoxy-7-phosphoheptulonate synthase